MVNTDELEYALLKAERRVLQIQTKLHRWASDDPHRRFDDLYNGKAGGMRIGLALSRGGLSGR